MRETSVQARKTGGVSVLLLVAAALACLGCGPAREPGQAAKSPDPGKDFFPDKVRVRHAKGFSVRYEKGYALIEVANPFASPADTMKYILVPRGHARPEGFGNAVLVPFPVRTMVCLSTTHIGLTDFLGVNHGIVGMSDTGRALNPDIRRLLRLGRIAEVGREQALNQEKVLALAPDLVMTVGYPGKEVGTFRPLMESGIAVVANSEWMEETLLGRMEWVKLLAAMVGREALAESRFDSVEAKYAEVKRIAATASHRPKVIGGNSRKGVWSVPGGRSYMAALLRDAGATYPFADDTTSGSRNLGFESVYREGLDAEVWLNAGWAKSLRDILDEDERYRDFRSFQSGLVFNTTKRMAANGSNEYWETGLVNPHLILADLVKVLHPELLAGYTLHYTRKLE